MAKIGIYDATPAHVWDQEWKVNCHTAGESHASNKYLAPFVFKAAISNHRIVRVEDHTVSRAMSPLYFRYPFFVPKMTF
jgi:hypothetical protein